MTTLLWKEFKENFKYAVGLFLVIGCLMIFASLSLKGYQANAGSFLTACWIYFQVVGAVFGILQTFPELKRDRWSFLCHRSQSMNGIFFSKIIAGLGYTLGITLFLYFFSAWIISSSQYKHAPFYWRDLWSSAVFLVTGTMSYFAAFLCGIRQRKWFGTRFFPLIFSFTISSMILSTKNQSAETLIPLTLLATAFLGITCWAHFTRTLDEIRKPLFSRVIRLITMYIISVPVQVMMTIFIIIIILANFPRNNVREDFVYDQEGNTYKVSVEVDGVKRKLISIEDVYHPERKLNIADFRMNDSRNLIKNQLVSAGISSHDSNRYNLSSNKNLAYYNYGSNWYYIPDENRMHGYLSLKTKKPVIINCEFDNLIGVGERTPNYNMTNPLLLTSENKGFFLFNTKKKFITPLEGPKIDKPIRAMAITLNKESKRTLILHENEIAIHEALPRVLKDNGEMVEPKLAPKEMASWTNKDDARFYHPDGFYPLHTVYIPGKELLRIPFNHRIPDNSSISIAKVPEENRFLIKVNRYVWQDAIWPESRLSTLLEIDDKGSILRREQYNLGQQYGFNIITLKLINTTCIPVGALLGMMAYDASTSTEVDEFYGTSFSSRMKRNPQSGWFYIGMIFLSCVFAAAVTFWIGRRNAFTRKEMTFWMLFNFFLGWGGVLTMISAHQWVGKVKCESCGKKRLQTNIKCEHCDAEFPLPELDGTEIFVESRSIVPMAEISSTAS